MCGIAGIYGYRESAPRVEREELLRIREAMARRGPDGAGLWIADDQRIGLAHRRLAIIDLSDGGAQPMATADGQFRITFNGEIYNYRALRRELEGKGFAFRSNSDTEVLLHLYADRGADMVHALRGMFAFGIWDEQARTLFLARDQCGIKPLYYADDGHSFRFASLVGALSTNAGVGTAEDLAGLAGFYLFGCVPEPFTCLRSVRLLPAGCTMSVTREGVRGPTTYFSISDEFRKAEAAPSRFAPDEAAEQIREVMRDSMRHHMVSDVPVGLFLSAGVDSSVLASLGGEIGAASLRAITLGFQEYRGTVDDETIVAGRTARELGIDHSTRWIQHGDFRGEWPAFFAAMDQPSSDGVNSYLVSRAAAEAKLKVAVSGLGGDELFGGYPSFRDVPRMRRTIPRMPSAGRALRRISGPVLRRITSPKYAGLLEYGSSYAGAYLLRRALFMPWELGALLGRERAKLALEALRPMAALEQTIEGLTNERCIVAALELSWYMRNQLLRDSDWAGMHHGVEIRVPFVDVAVIRALAPMIAGPNPPTKQQLANVLAEPMASEIARRRKTGFSVPVRDWLTEDLPELEQQRGLRGWARVVARKKRGPRMLSFVTDAFGGHGGIALYNRDLLSALCSYPGAIGVVALPRHMPNPPEPMPDNLAFVRSGLGGKLRFMGAAWRILRDDRGFDVVVCGHINLMPLARFASWRMRVPLLLVIYGIDAWQPTPNRIANALTRRATWVASISEITARRFRAWSDAPGQCVVVLPNAIHTEWYGPGERSPVLLDRYGIAGKTILMTVGRLVSAERYKGFDEVLEVLPALAESIPDIRYVIVGDGSDRARLQEKAHTLGIASRVVFTGNIAESEKADHYRLADAYVMPSRGEGFGFVLLEAMACGVPVIASAVDGGREAVRDGTLGRLVEPTNRADLIAAVHEALRQPHGVVPDGLDHYSFANFEARTHALIGRILPESRPLAAEQ
jgi:asparagine synthase (glutamine-hydrolysing)